MFTNKFFQLINCDTSDITSTLVPVLPQLDWKWVPFMHVAVDIEIIEQQIIKNKFISNIRKEFGGNLYLYKLPQVSVYRWHRDKYVGCSLNMVFDKYHCHTLFSQNNGENTDLIQPFTELTYKINKLYIFNSQNLHTVINLDRDRILFSYTFPREINYNSVLEWYMREEGRL